MFAPYHQFQNCSALERSLTRLGAAGNVLGPVQLNFQQYHYAVRHKLKAAMHNLTRLEAILINPTDQDIANPSELVFQANLYLDGFFYCGGGALDVLAREVLSFYGLAFPQRVYYQTARYELGRHRPADPLTPRLADPTWLREFRDYQNAATHELLLADQLNVNIRLMGAVQERVVVLPLPNDPRQLHGARTYTNNPNAVEYCRTHFRRLVSHINTIYGELRARSDANGRLPL